MPARAPHAKGYPLVGLALQMRKDPLGTMNAAFAKLGGEAIYLKLGPYRATLVRHPELIKRIFVDNAENYSKQTRGYEKAKIVLGQGLVTSEGALWQRQRRIATPAFHRQRVAGFAGTMNAATTTMLDEWQSAAKSGQPIDVFAEMMRVTLIIAVQTLLGVTGGPELQRVSTSVSEVLERTNDIITNPLSPPLWVPLPKYRRFKRALDTLNEFVYRSIKAKRADDGPGADLLSMLLAARDADGEGMSDQQLRDEAVTILIAGHETTANVLTWALHLLGQHPDVQRAVREEVAAVLAGVEPTVEMIGRLPLTRAVIDESMRLYPPAWMLGRAAKADDALGDFAVRAGEFVLISPYITHRNPTLWDNPDRFDPQRFLDGRSERLQKFSYLPFGGGNRFCIGSNFASMQAALMLSAMVQRYAFTPMVDHPVVPYAMITLRPKFGIRMTIRDARLA